MIDEEEEEWVGGRGRQRRRVYLPEPGKAPRSSPSIVSTSILPLPTAPIPSITSLASRPAPPWVFVQPAQWPGKAVPVE